jgi:L-serine deaminase
MNGREIAMEHLGLTCDPIMFSKFFASNAHYGAIKAIHAAEILALETVLRTLKYLWTKSVDTMWQTAKG